LLGGGLDYIVSPMAFVCGYYPFIKSSVTVFDYFFVFFLLILAVSGLCNLCAVLFENRAGTIANGLLIVLWAAGGIEPTVEEIYSSLKGFGKFLVWISPFRRTFEISAVMEGRVYSEAYYLSVENLYGKFRFVEDRYNADVMYLILYWVVTNAIAVLALVWKRDNYRYWRNFKEDTWYPLFDRIVTTSTFDWVEKCYESVVRCFNSVDKTVSKFFLQLIRNTEGLADDSTLCNQSLQDLLQRPNLSLDSPCDECGKPVQDHRRKEKSATSLSIMAQQRKRHNKGQNSGLLVKSGTNKKNHQFDRIVEELGDLDEVSDVDGDVAMGQVHEHRDVEAGRTSSFRKKKAVDSGLAQY
jgi:hypothetical protein